MEKYRAFADASTGVNPFVPLWSHHKRPLLLRFAKFCLFLPIATVRLLLLLVAIVWLTLAAVLATLVPLALLRRPIYRLLTFVGCKVALFAFGIVATGDTAVEHRRLKLNPPKTNAVRSFGAHHGTLVFANHQSFIDILLLGARICPTFVIPAADGTPVAYGLLGAFWRAGARELPGPPAKPEGLGDIVRRAQKRRAGPIVVFAEGARTNGSGVLLWKPKTFELLPSFVGPAGTALLVFDYSKAGAYTPHHTVGSHLRHSFWLTMQAWHTVKTSWFEAADLTAALRGKSKEESVAFLRSSLVHMAPGSVDIAVEANTLPEFMRYWDTSHRKGYTKQQKKA
eukprot:NODE_10457_length_1350_cov_8.106296.p1 GENE.NODE_10457_length_1350_cov_8.106296~~NODE_10457_length_1350_cov_8.106296.p1  ORF type:complete len:352 (-),score=99.23 NODE_10457_length_1350_cov_8.106296:293-1312(-)